MQQRVLVDYFVCSFKISDFPEAISIFRLFNLPTYDDPTGDFFGMDGFTEINSYYGLDTCFYYGGIKIHIGEDLVILDCSGKGCRTLEGEFDIQWETLFEALKHDLTYTDDLHPTPKAHISRLDVACDVLGSEKFTVMKIWDYVKHGKYVCKSKRKVHGEGDEEWIYFGSAQSDRRFRIYNKALEQGTEEPWVRLEMQLRNDNAISFVLNYYKLRSVPETYYGVMHDYLRILKERPDGTHYDRIELARFWEEFLSGIRKLRQCYLPKPARTVDDFLDYVRTNVASTVRTYLELTGDDPQSLYNLAMAGKMNRKQKDLVDQRRREKENDRN